MASTKGGVDWDRVHESNISIILQKVPKITVSSPRGIMRRALGVIIVSKSTQCPNQMLHGHHIKNKNHEVVH